MSVSITSSPNPAAAPARPGAANATDAAANAATGAAAGAALAPANGCPAGCAGIPRAADHSPADLSPAGLSPAELSPAFMERALMEELRLYHHPVGITWLFDETDIGAFKAQHPDWQRPVRPTTFCQWELAARMQGKTVLGTVDKLFCSNAQVSFGWREIDDHEVRSQLKYCRDEEQARRFLAAKPRLEQGRLAALAVQPLGRCARIPDVVHLVTDAMQAYHMAVDFMAAMDIHPLPTQILMSSSSCGGAVHCWQSGLYNFTTPCSGAYNSGKMERGEANVFIPGKHLRKVVARMLERKGTCGSSTITRPGDCFPGADICKNCPVILFHQ